jgi:multicomponent Na+:H+ antiporter subunit D
MISLPPALFLFAGAVLLPFLPRRLRSASFLVFAAATFVWLLSLHPGDSLTVPFLTYTLTVTRVDLLSLCFGYVFVLVTLFGGVFAFHVKDTASRLATLLYAVARWRCLCGDLLTLLFLGVDALPRLSHLGRGTISHAVLKAYLIVHLSAVGTAALLS